MHPAVDDYVNRNTIWQAELTVLRAIVLGCLPDETLKWGVPCYTFQGNNVVLMHVFKTYCAHLFVKGSMLADTRGVLVRQTENTQASRQIRFTNVQAISELTVDIKAYIDEAIEIEKAGVQVVFKKTGDYAVPEEFQRQLDENADMQKAFGGLTPGRQRAYLLHFAGPKQVKTRVSRIEKCIPHILAGKGLTD